METKKPATLESILDALDDHLDRRIAKEEKELAELATHLLTLPLFTDPEKRTVFLASSAEEQRAGILLLLRKIASFAPPGDTQTAIGFGLRYLRHLGTRYLPVLHQTLVAEAKNAETKVS